MTTTKARSTMRPLELALAAACLFWLALAGCSREPYILDDDDLTGELPDQDLAALAEGRDFEGHEMEEWGEDPSHYSASACTAEEWAAHIKASTMPDGRILEDAPLCRKHRPAAPKNAAPPAAVEPAR